MKFIITRASAHGLGQIETEIRHKGIVWDLEHVVHVIEVNKVVDMAELVEHYDHPIIIDRTNPNEGYATETRAKYPYQITVYDDYIE